MSMPDRADVGAGAAEGGCVRQRRRDAALAHELRLEDRPDRAPVDRRIRVTAGLPVDGADVHARGAADTAERRPPFGIGQSAPSVPRRGARDGRRTARHPRAHLSRATCTGSSAPRSPTSATTAGAPPRSRHSSTTFSTPITVTRVRGSVVHMRPFPSDSTTQIVPVSATAAFAPEIATVARRNAERRYERAAAVSADGSSASSGWSRAVRRMSAISRRLRWSAGTSRCEGRSPQVARSAPRGRSRAAGSLPRGAPR